VGCITDESLKTFSRLPRLEGLSLQGNRFTDKGLEYLRAMKQLKRLCIGLGDNQITDEGLVYLKALANLEVLDLQKTRVTAKGLEHLTSLTSLKELWLNMDVGDLTSVKQALPNCKIGQ
jgi:Ran GTPase-activating protein (RanGAP) involved in mRNA processing and transport